jgi:GrpB-like predicted nucleotidyltransferase (UPF0157 family)
MEEDELRAVTIGELKPYATKVVVTEYDPRWPEWFATNKSKIEAALGQIALSVEHTGSTSVPGLPAKPIIDVLLQVPDSAAEPTYVPALEAAGYTLRIREPEWLEHRCFHVRGGSHDVNLHVFSPRYAAEEIHRILAFRDWLRTHSDDRDRYAAVKRELSTRDWRYVQDYADAKTPVVEEILAKALAT